MASVARFGRVSSLSEFLARRSVQSSIRAAGYTNGHGQRDPMSVAGSESMGNEEPQGAVDCERILSVVRETLDALVSSASTAGREASSSTRQAEAMRSPVQHDAFLPHLHMSDTNMVGMLADSAAAVVSSQGEEPLQQHDFIAPPPVLFELGPDDQGSLL